MHCGSTDFTTSLWRTTCSSASSPSPPGDVSSRSGVRDPCLTALLAQVVATEVSKSGVAAAKRNLELNGVGNVFVARMSSEEFTEAWQGGRHMNRCVCGGRERDVVVGIT